MATSYYFGDAEKAREAQAALHDAGYSDVEVHSSDGGSETFMDRVREFFGAQGDSDHAGAAILTAGSPDAKAATIVRQYGGHEGGGSTLAGRTGDSGDEQRLQLHEERVNVRTEKVAEGEFRASKEVVTERQNVDVPIYHDEVYVERRPVESREATDGTIGEDSKEVRIPVTHEEVRVEKRPVTTEEIVIGKRRVEETKTVGAEVRKERARFDSDVDVDESNVRDST